MWWFESWWLGTGLRFRRWKVRELARTVLEIEGSGCLYKTPIVGGQAGKLWELARSVTEGVGLWVFGGERVGRVEGVHRRRFGGQCQVFCVNVSLHEGRMSFPPEPPVAKPTERDRAERSRARVARRSEPLIASTVLLSAQVDGGSAGNDIVPAGELRAG